MASGRWITARSLARAAGYASRVASAMIVIMKSPSSRTNTVPAMVVRSARGDDFEAVTALLEELGRPAVAPEVVAACRAAFEADVADPDADHLVAAPIDGDGVLGVLSLHFRTRLNYATEEAWVPDFVVAERARGQGVGRALLEEAEARALNRGCHLMTLESAHWRGRAHAIYTAFGMRDVGKSFAKLL
jgi:GNAT superfamily N-acetyltransferase